MSGAPGTESREIVAVCPTCTAAASLSDTLTSMCNSESSTRSKFADEDVVVVAPLLAAPVDWPGTPFTCESTAPNGAISAP